MKGRGKGQEISLTINQNSGIVEKIECDLFKKGKNKFSCQYQENDIKKCLFDELLISQLELYNKSSYYIQEMMNRCHNCENLTFSELVDDDYKEIPEGLTREHYYSGNGKFVNPVLCSTCNNKMRDKIYKIKKKYNL